MRELILEKEVRQRPLLVMVAKTPQGVTGKILEICRGRGRIRGRNSEYSNRDPSETLNHKCCRLFSGVV